MSLVYVLFKDSVTGRERKGQRSARVLLSDTKEWSQRRSVMARETKDEAEGEIGFRRVKWRQRVKARVADHSQSVRARVESPNIKTEGWKQDRTIKL